jgi:hypothetical protein
MDSIKRETIERLRAESREWTRTTHNRAYMHGMTNGEEWCENSHFAQIRSVSNAFNDALEQKPQPEDWFTLLRQSCGQFREATDEEFSEWIGAQENEPAPIDVAKGFFHGVHIFVVEARNMGVTFFDGAPDSKMLFTPKP